jgi:hypothetical protein
MSGGIITGAVASVAGNLVGALDGLFTSDEERKEAELKLTQTLMQPQIIQALTTLKEAEHPSVFVAGWRPALGWISALGIGWEFVIRPSLAAGLHIASLYFGEHSVNFIQAASELPSLDTAQLMALITLLLGVAGYRTFEKTKGIARSK